MDFESFVLTAATAELAEEPDARLHADAVEFRMDLAAEPLAQLAAYDGELPIIATNRVEWDGGDAPDTAERVDALVEAVAEPAVDAVDVELGAVQAGDVTPVVETAREEGVSIVVSAHDFEGMPSRDELRTVLTEAAEHGDVAKFAGTAARARDALDLLAVTLELTDSGDLVATMAMGEPGRHTRAVAPLYGSRIGYAPVDPARVTAPGQYDLATLRSLIDRLRSERSRTED